MILRNYKGHIKNVGRQQVSSMILMNSLKRIDPNFSILKEAKREVLEDLMDINNTQFILDNIENKKIIIEEIVTTVPSPFAFGLIAQGYTDILKMEDKVEFLKRMHNNVLTKLSLKKDIDKEYIKDQKSSSEVDYHKIWENEQNKELDDKEKELQELRLMMWNQDNVPRFAKEELVKLLEGDKDIRPDVIEAMETYKDEIKKNWPKKLQDAVFKKIKEIS
jgi:hypothetical protein